MSSDTTTIPAHEVRARLRALWELGDYPRVARTVIPSLGADLVTAAGVHAGQRVLDVAAGAGNASIPAALAGARVTAVDIAPALLDAGREAAARAGLAADAVDWQVGDAEDLDVEDASYDVVLSTVGVMFAPHHEAAAGELLRACRSGGTVALASWTPAGFVGQLLATLRPYAAPPLPGSQPPPLWGDEAHVRALFGDGVSTFSARNRVVHTELDGPEALRDLFRDAYGPAVAVYARTDDPDRRAALDADIVAVAERFGRWEGSRFAMDWEYLEVVATRA